MNSHYLGQSWHNWKEQWQNNLTFHITSQKESTSFLLVFLGPKLLLGSAWHPVRMDSVGEGMLTLIRSITVAFLIKHICFSSQTHKIYSTPSPRSATQRSQFRDIVIIFILSLCGSSFICRPIKYKDNFSVSLHTKKQELNKSRKPQ